MRLLFGLILMAATACAGESTEEQKAVAAVQRLFDAMLARDAEAARVVVLPDARLVAVRDGGAATVTAIEQFTAGLAAGKEPWLERIWEPKVMVHGAIAVVWASYDFHQNGKFTHCGVDSVSLVKTGGEWKIAGIAYTAETKACPASPLGPPAGQ
jgi:hypothetical protein